MSHSLESLRSAMSQQINTMAQRGMYFWDYGNAFLKEAGEAGADIFDKKTPSGYPLRELCRGHHGADVLRFWVWAVPLGLLFRRWPPTSKRPTKSRPTFCKK